MEQINIAKILKDCPSGMELDCAMYDNVQFDTVQYGNIYPIKINTPEGRISLSKYGCYSLNPQCKCIIFPKGKTTWEGFQRPFKDGDVLYIDCNDNGDTNKRYQYIFILKEIIKSKIYCYCYIDKANVFKGFEIRFLADQPYYPRLATEEEKQKLFQAIKENGYKWNPKTNNLEKLIEPKFKVGNRVKHKDGYFSGVVTEIDGEYFRIKYDSDAEGSVDIRYQDEYELVPNKFNITTLKPFDRVLTRVTTGDVWGNDFFGYYKDGWFHCSGHIAVHYCIPYENNERLLGTTSDCDEYYKTWE